MSIVLTVASHKRRPSLVAIKTQTNTWKATTLHRNVFAVDIPYQANESWEFSVLLTADRHWDNPHSDQSLQKRHLEQAKAIGAPVVDVGDFFCAMQGKYDKRSSKGDIRPEHQHGNYLDRLVDTAVEAFQPYAKNLVVIASGNHEESIAKNHETNLIERLVSQLNAGGKASVQHGGFAGWVFFRFKPTKGGPWRTVKLHYDHGYGGGGPVTRDVIQSSRRAVYLPDADIVVSGHTHDQWSLPITRARVSSQGVPYLDEQLHVKLPTYKEEYGDGFSGWHARRGAPPKPVGGIWLKFSYSSRTERIVTNTLRTD